MRISLRKDGNPIAMGNGLIFQELFEVRDLTPEFLVGDGSSIRE